MREVLTVVRPDAYLWSWCVSASATSANELERAVRDYHPWDFGAGDGCRRVGSMTALPPGIRAGFMACGQWPARDWRTGLAEALGTCRVFVPLYSRRYFQSEHCGKEWSAFARRPRTHRGGAAGRAPTIVPALWGAVEPQELPPAARVVDVHHAAL